MGHPLKKNQNDRPLLGDAGEDVLIADTTPRPALSDDLLTSARQLAGDATLTQEQARQKLWSQVQNNPPSMPPQTLARWGDDQGRRDAAMDGLMRLATDPNRAGQDPNHLTHLWANGMAGNPGAYERNNPPPPDRTWGQVVGYETDPYGPQRQFPLMDGVRADWHDTSALIGDTLALPAQVIGDGHTANQLQQDAERDRQAVEAMREQYQYDPNATMLWEIGRYGRRLTTGARGLNKIRRWMGK